MERVDKDETHGVYGLCKAVVELKRTLRGGGEKKYSPTQ
jgi:hypothetical protein